MPTESVERKTNTGIVTFDDYGNPLILDTQATPTSTGKKRSSALLKANVLNSYRSYTYKFTLATIDATAAGNYENYSQEPLKNIILKSGGKGTTDTMSSTAISKYRDQNAQMEVYDKWDGQVKQTNANYLDNTTEALEGFKISSSGRFDLFIDDLQMTNLGSFTPETGETLAQGMNFTVIEPYGVNGFLEALHAASMAAGYLNYKQAHFVLKVEFVGYPDDKNLPDPEIIPGTIRYIPVLITDVKLELTEAGSKYAVTAVNPAVKTMGISNKTKNPIAITGNTVGEILKNFIKGINEQSLKDAKEMQAKDSAIKTDQYDIKFPVWDDSKNSWDLDSNKENEIAGTRVNELLKDKQLYEFADQQTTTKPTAYDKGGKNQPSPEQNLENPVFLPLGKNTAQFPADVFIHNCISAIIRDSEYLKNILKDIKNKVDPNGFINYFLISTKQEFLSDVDLKLNRKLQKITYIVTPYKLHYSNIPTYRNIAFPAEDLEPLTNRKYSYMFTGQNVDVLSFRLNYDFLFYEAVPTAYAMTDYMPSKDGAAPGNTPKALQKDNPEQNITRSLQPIASTEQDAALTASAQPYLNAGPLKMTQWDILARNMHDAIINSRKTLTTAEIEIIGDPFYITNNNIGSYNPSLNENKTQTKNGEAAMGYRELIIRVDFKNPVDYGDNGFMQFDPKGKPPFVGYYKVTQIKSTFKDGKFTQVLNINRFPSQIVEEELIQVPIEDKITTVGNPYDAAATDTSPVKQARQGVSRVSDILNQLSQIAAVAANPSAFISSQVSSLAKSISDKASELTSNATASVSQVKNEITAQTNGITASAASLASKFGVTAENIKTLGPAVLAGLAVINKSLPNNVNIGIARAQGLSLSNVPANKLKNIPAAQPFKVAPIAEPNIKDMVTSVQQSGSTALASSLGAKNSGQILSSRIDPAVVKATLTAAPTVLNNPLTGSASQSNTVNAVVASDKNLSVINQVSQSVEVNLQVANAQTNNTSLTAKYGSKQSSPLSKLFLNT